MVCAIALVVLPFDFREALINTLIGTVMALSLVVITGFVGQISVVQLTLAGVSGFTISHLAVNAGIGFPLAPLAGTLVAVILGLITAASALRVRGVSLAVVTLAAVVAITNFGFLNTTWGGGQTGSPVPELKLLGLDLGPRVGVPRTRRQPPEPRVRLGRARGYGGRVPDRRPGSGAAISGGGCSPCAQTSAPPPRRRSTRAWSS